LGQLIIPLAKKGNNACSLAGSLNFLRSKLGNKIRPNITILLFAKNGKRSAQDEFVVKFLALL
jgi:hypothetical protein